MCDRNRDTVIFCFEVVSLRRFYLISLRKILIGVTAAAVVLAFAFSVCVLRDARTVSVPITERRTLILDAGHGGEDGGAVAWDGTKESDINLSLTLQLRELFLFCGVEPKLTRDKDISVYTEGAKTLREKKVSDIHNRVAQIDSLPNATLISIHQNSLPSSPKTHGAVVFYNGEGNAHELAKAVQGKLNAAHNEREKEEQEIARNIYLMQHIHCPAILVECGFLSNAEELSHLKTQETQFRIALAVLAGYFTL